MMSETADCAIKINLETEMKTKTKNAKNEN